MVLLLSVSPLILALLEQIKGLFYISDWALGKPHYLLISNLEVDRSFLKQVIDLLVVDLKIGDAY